MVDVHEAQEIDPLIGVAIMTPPAMEEASSPLSVRIPVTLLTTLFGIGSWIAINGLWVELPLLVSLDIPEGYSLASYLTVIIQLANVGPVLFTLANYCLFRGRRIEIPTVYLIVALGCLASLLMAFFWDAFTVWRVDGRLHSTALLVLAFFLSIVDCTSSVAFTPFMSLLRNSYLTWYFIGEGMSSLLPSVVALVQGVGSRECVSNGTYVNRTVVANRTFLQNCTDWESRDLAARFPPQDFFGFLFAMMLTCGVAFTLLNRLPLARREHIAPASKSSARSSSTSSSESHSLVTCSTEASGRPAPDEAGAAPRASDGLDDAVRALLTRREIAYLFALLCFVCALSNGALPSVQSYSCAPYGLDTYLLASTLANMANPVAASLVMLRPSTSLALVGVTTALGTVFASYCMATAALSPAPPLQYEPAGKALIVLAWILMVGLFTYTKATIAWILRGQPGHRSLLICYGGVTQLGSLIGSFTMWPLVNVAQVFRPFYEDVCRGYVRCRPIPESVAAYKELPLI